MLALLETLSKIFNRNAVKGRQQLLNLCNVSKTPPFQKLLGASLRSAYSVFKKIPEHACRLVQNIVGSLYLVAEP
jgi:hypothetical protein